MYSVHHVAPRRFFEAKPEHPKQQPVDQHRLALVRRTGRPASEWTVPLLSLIENANPSGILREGPAGRTGPMLLTNGPISFEDAVLAPDGSTLFARGVVSSSQLARFDSKRREFAPFWKGVPAIDVSFSNDGSRAVYRRLPEDTLWVSRSDGSEPRQLTPDSRGKWTPRWSPDGRYIAALTTDFRSCCSGGAYSPTHLGSGSACQTMTPAFAIRMRRWASSELS